MGLLEDGGVGVWWGEWGKAAIRERRHGNTNCNHHVIKDQMKQNALLHWLHGYM